MTKANDKELERLETPECLVVYTPSRTAYLLTFYTPPGGKSVVLLQASHEAACLQFPDLEGATAHIARLFPFQSDRKEL